MCDGTYYAILNVDGTIRGNKLFKGNLFSTKEETIDLDKYESIEAFKLERKEWCNQIKQKNKNALYETFAMLSERGSSRTSLCSDSYLDTEATQTLGLKK